MKLICIIDDSLQLFILQSIYNFVTMCNSENSFYEGIVYDICLVKTWIAELNN